jgi:hypothetical protein
MKPQLASRWLLGLGAAIVLGLVFASYLEPDMMVQLATQLWNCF